MILSGGWFSGAPYFYINEPFFVNLLAKVLSSVEGSFRCRWSGDHATAE